MSRNQAGPVMPTDAIGISTPRQQRATYTVEEAARLLGIGRQLAYDLIRQQEFPVPVLRLGVARQAVSAAPRRIVIPRAPLDALLRGDTLAAPL